MRSTCTSPSRKPNRLHIRYRPAVTRLEDRTLMSTCIVNRLTDNIEYASADAIDLRRCINFANNNPGPDEIKFAIHGIIGVNSALPGLNSDISIEGPGADLLAISGNDRYRVFTVGPGANVRLSGLRITHGFVTSTGRGAGVHNSGDLIISESKVTANTSSANSLSTTSCGGIFNSGTIVLDRSSVSKNAVIIKNSAPIAEGGGICNSGTMTINDSAITDNSAIVEANFDSGVVRGGGIYSKGTLTVSNSLVARNVAGGDGVWWDTVGGGIVSNGTLTVVNSTIAANTANGFGGGGGLFTSGGSVMIRNSTIAQNSVYGNGGGIYNVTSGSLSMQNTIIASNSANFQGKDLYGHLTSSGHNLIGISSGGSGYNDTDLLDVDPNLGPLQDNGGMTHTMALRLRSPAIGAGDNTDAPEWDQRGVGYPRIVNGTIDIGAFEVQNSGTASGFTVNVAVNARSPHHEERRIGRSRIVPSDDWSSPPQALDAGMVIRTPNANGIKPRGRIDQLDHQLELDGLEVTIAPAQLN